MAKQLPQILTNVDTFQSWITKTNQVIDVLATEVLTANSTLGVTGDASAQRNSRLFGSFTANTLVAATAFTVGGVSANATHLTVTSRFVANGSSGTTGQILTSNGSGTYWSSLPVGSGTVTQVQGGNGLNGNITTSGSLTVDAKTGLVANSTGLYVNTAFIQSLVQTSPPVITGDLNMNNNDITNVDRISGNVVDFLVSMRAPTYFLGLTGNHNLTAVDLNSVGLQLGTGPQILFGIVSGNNVRIGNPGSITFATAGTDRLTIAATGEVTIGTLEVGFKTIPSFEPPISGIISTNAASGRHFYKTATGGLVLTVPDNTAESCPIGTAITIVNDDDGINNDGNGANITLTQGGATQLQLAGTFNRGNRTIAPGGLATLIKVATNKWIVSGPGVS